MLREGCSPERPIMRSAITIRFSMKNGRFLKKVKEKEESVLATHEKGGIAKGNFGIILAIQ